MAGDEEVDVVDEADETVGRRNLGDCLRLGLLHRAVAILVRRSDGRILLQRRSEGDDWQPGMWTLSCTGHVKSGETFRDAAKRELEEELGLGSSLIFRRKLLLPPITEGGLVEKEWVALFSTSTDAPCSINRDEIDAVQAMTRAELEAMVDSGRLTPDAKFILTDYLAGD